MLQSAEGEPVTGVGVEFIIRMDREALGDIPMGKYTTNVIITAFEPDRLVEWGLRPPGQDPLGYRYGYIVEPAEGGSLVTSYFDWSGFDLPPEYRAMLPLLPEATHRATLGILARLLETNGGLRPAQPRPM